jgi:hypothetical protein
VQQPGGLQRHEQALQLVVFDVQVGRQRMQLAGMATTSSVQQRCRPGSRYV